MRNASQYHSLVLLGLPLVTPLRAGAVPSGLRVPAAVLVLVAVAVAVPVLVPVAVPISFSSWPDSLRSDVFSVLSPRFFLRADIDSCATVRQTKVLSSNDMTCCLYP